MDKIKEKIVATLGAVLFGFFILAVYVLKHTVPLTDIYLGKERISHVLVVFISGLLGTLLLYILKKLKMGKASRFAGYGFSSLLMAGVPILLFFTQTRSFRGSEWALETLIIGLIPLLFIYAAFLVFCGNRIVNLFLAFIFAAFSIYHIFLLIRILPRLGKAFSTMSTMDVWILIILAGYGALCSFVSLRQYLSFKK